MALVAVIVTTTDDIVTTMKMPRLPKVPTPALPGPVSAALPSPGTVILAVRVTAAAVPPVIRHGDLRAVKHLPFVLTHLDDAALVAGAISDPVGSAIKAPGAAVKLGVRGVKAAPGAALRAPGAAFRAPGAAFKRLR